MTERVEVEIVASDKASGVFKGVQGSLSNLGSSLTGIGTKLSLGVTAPLTALGIASVTQFGNFDAAIQRAGAFVDATAEQMDGFRKAAIEAARGTAFSF